ncbi:MAG: LysM peptidoglycan-binding domain-containing protein [Desulfurella sp.]|uniref:LysM peptidoglycan-binding domain-containing protein n=2 Tax=Desulfurella sp. TaxID=1962857 RepID=UPI003D115C88
MRKTILSAFLFLTLTATSRAEVYIVKKGDTLTTIAQKLGLPLEKLKYANPGIKSTDLSIGQKILIPQIKTTTSNSQTASNVITSKVYIVQKGDNAFNISKKLGCSLDQLKNLNPNINLSNLNVGDRIIVPNNTKIVSNTQLTNIYIVKSGDTASTIANKYNVSLSELEKLNPQLNLSNINIGDRIILPNNVLNDIKNTQIAAQKKTFKNENFYTVEPGDTLTAISQKTGINMNIIKSLNPSIDWSNLQIGEEIVLRPSLQKEQTKLSNNDIYPKENQDINYIKYTVTPGDTLFSIAKTFSTTINELKKINSLTSNNLSIGQTILVPPKIMAIKSMQNNNSSNKTPTYQAKNNTDQQQNNDQSVALDNSETNNYSLYLDHYTVQKGDTLYQIAKKFNISVDDIVALNNLPNKEITVGEILLIPNNNNNKNIASIQKNYSTSEYSLINKENPLSERLIKYAKLFVGTPYQWGGTNLETGVDCSGFVQDVFAKFHIDLPRTSSEQFNVGKPVSLSDIKPGDLLFFQTYPGTYPSHVGIYIGDDKFISALNQNTGVVISPLDGYFLKRFVGARRVLPSNQKFNDNTGNRSG